jgi:hypothetical protein
VTGWADTQQEMHRAPDMAALPEAEAYNASALTAVKAGAYVTEINGQIGSNPRGAITISKVSGLKARATSPSGRQFRKRDLFSAPQ